MNKQSKNFENIKKMVGSIPADYMNVKSSILRRAKENPELFDIWLSSYLLDFLPFENKWERKYIYLLTHDLLNSNELTLNDDIINELYDIDNDLVGNCSMVGVKGYINEPTNINELVAYIRGYDWL